MPRTFFTADTHFGHTSIIKPTFNTPRTEFSTIAEHDDTLIHNWNAIVGPRDTVYHVGDFAYCKDDRHIERCFRRLNGRKVLVVGNHDQRARRLPWAEQHEGIHQTAVDGTHLVLCHYPMRSWPRAYRGSLHLYGHTHSRLPGTRRSADVGVDAWGYRPVALEEVVDVMALTDTWPEELHDHPDAVAERKARDCRA